MELTEFDPVLSRIARFRLSPCHSRERFSAHKATSGPEGRVG